MVIVASGPSATDADLSACRRFSTIAVNDSYRLCPWADVLYACDKQWWATHIKAVRQTFAGQLWTSDEDAARDLELFRVVGHMNPGLSKTPNVIHFNSNSGAQAINLAVNWGARQLVLVGFDMKLRRGQRHWFGDHPGLLNKASDYPDWVQKFKRIADDLKKLGVRVINASPDSALPYFEKCPLPIALSGISPSTGETPLSPDCGPAATA